MDEGRLGIVMRQEERHRKFVYVMNDIVRTQLGFYNSCLAREQHEASIKLVNSCVEVRRSIVRQKVLKKCLEMRRRKVQHGETASHHLGRYGGQPLWAMSRDIERVIADNHPRIRRAKHVQEMMRKSMENGAILDEDAVKRRMEAFLQVKQGRQEQKKKSTRGDNAVGLFGAFSSGRGWKLPPLDPAARSRVFAAAPPAAADGKKAGATIASRLAKKADRDSSQPSLKLDAHGRLVGIAGTMTTSHPAHPAGRKDEQPGENPAGRKTVAGNDETLVSGSDVAKPRSDKADDAADVDAEGEAESESLAVDVEDTKDGRKQEDAASAQDEVDDRMPASRPRSRLILPPIESSKALASRTPSVESRDTRASRS